MMGSVNYITTILNCRAPGMTLMRMPLTIWGMFVTAILQSLALPVLTVALIMQFLDKTVGTVFFLPPAGLSFGNWQTGTGGGQPLLWQHLFWFYSHPAVYIMILPAMGMVSDVLVAFCRKPFWLQADGFFDDRNCRFRLYRLGTPYVPKRDGSPTRNGFYGGHHPYRLALGCENI